MAVSPPRIAVLILAAGSSSRMGQSKQLLPWKGTTLLEHAIQQALALHLQHTVVVLGSMYEQHKAAVNHLPVSIINNPHWQQGMGTSLKAGIAYIEKEFPDTEAVIVMVSDQPYVDSTTLQSFIEIYQQTHAPIVAARYAGVLGVPALFDKSFFQHLLKVNDQEGARKILQQHVQEVHALDFPEGVIDLDTPEAYQQAKAST